MLLSYLTPALSPCDSCFKAQFLRRILLFSWDDIALCRQKTVKKVMTKDDFVAKGCNNLRWKMLSISFQPGPDCTFFFIAISFSTNNITKTVFVISGEFTTSSFTYKPVRTSRYFHITVVLAVKFIGAINQFCLIYRLNFMRRTVRYVTSNYVLFYFTDNL